MAQISLFDAPKSGDLDLFLRYDFVSLGQDSLAGRARQQAIRSGFNYNLPYTGKLASLHFEYAHNTVSGPAAIITQARPGDEVRIGLRVSLQRYIVRDVYAKHVYGIGLTMIAHLIAQLGAWP